MDIESYCKREKCMRAKQATNANGNRYIVYSWTFLLNKNIFDIFVVAICRFLVHFVSIRSVCSCFFSRSNRSSHLCQMSLFFIWSPSILFYFRGVTLARFCAFFSYSEMVVSIFRLYFIVILVSMYICVFIHLPLPTIFGGVK